MKMLAEYVESAIKFEKMAAQEKDPKLKAEFESRPCLIESSRKKGPRNTASTCLQSASKARVTVRSNGSGIVDFVGVSSPTFFPGTLTGPRTKRPIFCEGERAGRL